MDLKFRVQKGIYIDVRFHLSASRTSLEAYFHFKFRLSRTTNSLGACLNSKFPISHGQELVVYKANVASKVQIAPFKVNAYMPEKEERLEG